MIDDFTFQAAIHSQFSHISPTTHNTHTQAIDWNLPMKLIFIAISIRI